MCRRIAFIGVLAVSCESHSAETQTAQPPPVSGPALTALGESGIFRFEVTLAPTPPKLNEFFSAWVRVLDAATGEPVTQGQLSLDATMPEHGHGMQTQPRTHSYDDGRWQAVGLKFHMHGRWVFAARLDSMGRTDKAELEYRFEPPRSSPAKTEER